MPELLTTAAQLQCPHGAPVTISSSNTTSKAAGAAVLRTSDTFTITSCPFMLGTVKHPCVRVSWVQPSGTTSASRTRTLTKASTGMCVAADQAVQGTVMVTSAQSKVQGR